MLAFDHRGSFKKFINKESPETVTNEQVVQAKAEIIEALANQFSAVLLDPDWGLPAYKNRTKPYLLCLERSGYRDEDGDRATELQYTVAQLKQWGASGAKLLVYFNPAAKNCAAQLEVSKKALEDCRNNDLPLFLEIVTYGNEQLGKSRAEWVLRSLQMFLDACIRPEVYKLEYPGDAASCAKITEMLGGMPWILLTRGETFEVFKEQLKVAIANGAVGFLAGRAVWQEFGQYQNLEAKEEFLNKVMKERFQIISDIACDKV